MSKMIGYARISKDEDGSNYDTIETQKKIIENYYRNTLNYQGEIIFFEDDNCSGYTFKRPDFQRLYKMASEGKINLLVCKDLSRFGRKNSKTLDYLEEFVDDYNIRFIAIGEGIDTINPNYIDTLGIFSWHNEHYVRDISRKIKANFLQRQKNANLLIVLPYGYKLEFEEIIVNGRRKRSDYEITIDNFTSEIVKEIFKLYINGYGFRKIADICNERKYPTPSSYKNRKDANSIWSLITIKNIIDNEFYIGTLFQGKTFKKKIRGKSIRKPEDEILKFEDNHIPIISKEDFYLAQKIKNERNSNNIKGTKGKSNIHLFSSKILCGKCKKSFVYKCLIRKRKTKEYKDEIYLCGTLHKFGKNYCQNRQIQEKTLIDMVRKGLENKLESNKKYLNELRIEIETNSNNEENINLDKDINKIKIEINKRESQLQQIYIDKLENKYPLPENVFIRMIDKTNTEIEILKEKLNDLINLNNDQNSKKQIILSIEEKNKQILNILNGELDKKNIELAIDKITIDDRLEDIVNIEFNF